ncbi:MAG: hypothetical protein MJ197_03150 [Bacteroidales bacterium]|nr:hypothetical protein [Bacteroidales bacterium]
MKRLIQLVICLSILTTSAFAKGGIGEKFFFQLGGTVGADVMNMSGVFCKDAEAKGIEPIEFSSLNVNFATISFVGRANFLEISNNSSLSLAFRPAISIGRAMNDLGSNSSMIRLPLTIGFNSGASATVATRAKTGFSFDLGAEFIQYPLGNAVDVCRNEGGQVLNVKMNWIQPVAVVGVKFFGKKYLCKELNFKACFMSMGSIDNKTAIDSNLYGTIYDWQSVGLMVSFLQYLNY